MGTRNLTAVYLDGQYKVAQYGQWDGYPEGQGITVLTFLRDKMDLELFKEALRNSSYIPSEELTALWKQYGADENGLVTMEDSDRMMEDHPEFSRNTGAGILEMVWRRITGITVSGWQQSGTWTRFRPMRNFLPHSKMMMRRKRLRFNG